MSQVLVLLGLGHDLVAMRFFDHLISVKFCIWIINDQIWQVGDTDIHPKFSKID